MGSNTKWIESRADEAASRVARRALKRHLARMWSYLELAVGQPAGEEEHVHQLRVFSRRAAAVMDAFACYLPRRRGRWLSKKLRKIRKAAGAARDLDVLLMRWSDYVRHTPSSHAALLLEQIKRHRQAAQGPIAEIYLKLARQQFNRRVKKLLKQVRARKSTGACGERFDCFARQAIQRVIGPYLRAAEGELHDAAAMHAFRIQSKQVRYAMEIFGGAFDEEFRKRLYPLIETLQNRLGAINDHVTAQTYFAAWHAEADSAAVRSALESGMDREQQDLESSSREFLAWWTSDRRDDLCRRLERYIDAAEPSTGEAPGSDSSNNN
ncbi:MAG: CHAD domain-containing protein [Pirellulales bacterium]